MKRKLIPLLLPLLLLCGCSESTQKKSFFAMDTYITVSTSGKNAADSLDKVCSQLTELEKLFSVTDESSDISRINLSEGKSVEVSPETAELIGISKDIYRISGGKTDITVYPLVKEWGFTTGENKIPDNETIERLLKFTDCSEITVDGNTVSVPDGFMLDFGSVAKGYAGKKSAELLKSEGIESAILDLGGNIQTVGSKPDGSPWKVAVADPNSPAETLCIVSVRDKAVVTSGNYQRYFIGDDGKNYCHIIDPETGFPADSGLASATVIGEDGAYCDGLSTALFVMGEEKAAEFIKQNKDYEAILVTEDGRIIISGGIFPETEFPDEETRSRAEVMK